MNCKICGAQYSNTDKECPNEINHGGEEPKVKNYSAMKKDELAALAQEKEIKLTGEESKADLITLLEKRDK